MKKWFIFVSIGLLLFIFFTMRGGGLSGNPESFFLARSTDPQNQPPKLVQVAIFPPTPSLQSTLVVHADAQDAEQDSISFQYRWIVNQNLVSEADHLPLTRFRQGDVVSVEVTPFDGKGVGMPVKAPPVNIGNNLPALSDIRLAMIRDDTGSAILATTEGSDLDGDPIHYVYEWRINGEAVTENHTDRLDAALYRDKDKITLLVTPADPFARGVPKMASMRVVNNYRPKITSLPPSEVADGIYTYQVVSEDLDKDPLSYALVEGPSDMVLHGDSGLLTWKVGPGSAQEANVVIRVVDGRGGEDNQRFTIQAAQ